MKALTLIEPWGWCIIHAGKCFEHRSWKPPASMVGKFICIHAGKTFDHGALRRIQRVLDEKGIPIAVPASVHHGHIIGIARITGWIDEGDGWADGEGPRGIWYGGGLAWTLDSQRALSQPVPCKGALGLWTVPGDVETAVREQLKVTT